MTWEQLETLFGIKFKLEDGTFRPVNEWLDDLYLQFTKEDIETLMFVIMRHGDDLFKDLLFHHK
jgi:hypothetical protein